MTRRNALRIMLCALVAAISIAAPARAIDYQSYVYIHNQSDRAVYVMVWHRSSPLDGSGSRLLTTWCAPPRSKDLHEVHAAANIVSFHVLTGSGCKDQVWLRTEREFPWHGESVTRWLYLIRDGDYKIDGPMVVR